MAPLAYIWKVVTNIVTLSPFLNYGSPQHPIGNRPHIADSDFHAAAPFYPPGSNIDGFTCDYRKGMPGWSSCQTATNKSCWLRHRNGSEITINTDYETVFLHGVTRKYTLVVEDGWWNADGQNFTEAKLINGTFPGPLIEACWGDTLEVTIINNMTFNGTSIHWHGIRQLGSMQYDGVNGITQCPIAPNDSFTYKIHLTQYGTSWLHSHFSVQYADGVQAPLTIHGPTSDNYDYPIEPLMMSDWGHNSAFEAQFTAQLANNSLVLNGFGDVTKYSNNLIANTTTIPDPTVILFNNTWKRSKANPDPPRYLLRIINSAYESGLVFSIDDHKLRVVEVDFVPVVSNSTYNHTANSVLVGIGQRYHVIVEALPQCFDPKTGKPYGNCNFWVRTLLAENCASDITTAPGTIPGTDPNPDPTKKYTAYSEVGILRYDAGSKLLPTSKLWPKIPLNCTEPYVNLTPVVPWQVSPPSNNQVNVNGEDFGINFVNTGDGPFQLATFSFQDEQHNVGTNFQTNYGNPTFLNLGSPPDVFPTGWMVIPENYKASSWVYLVINDNGHPIHLHGHDFAIIKRDFTNQYNSTIPLGCNAPNPDQKLDCNNPLRRDVVILSGWRNSKGNGGYTIIAFKTDNPGIWIMHCHIAFHASSGLAMQIMERQSDAYRSWPVGSPAVDAAQSTCKKWNDWTYDCHNYWPGKVEGVYPACINATELQNDSGI